MAKSNAPCMLSSASTCFWCIVDCCIIFLGCLWAVLEELWPYKATRALLTVQQFLSQNYHFVRPMLSWIQQRVHPCIAVQSVSESEYFGWLLYFFELDTQYLPPHSSNFSIKSFMHFLISWSIKWYPATMPRRHTFPCHSWLLCCRFFGLKGGLRWLTAI